MPRYRKISRRFVRRGRRVFRGRRSGFKRRRTFRGRRTTRRTVLRVKKTGIDDTAIIKFKYYDTEGLYSAVTGTTETSTYRGNSLYDPDETGIGHTPSGVLQWQNFYQKYYVYASKIKVWACNLRTNETARIMLGAYDSKVSWNDYNYPEEGAVKVVWRDLGPATSGHNIASFSSTRRSKTVVPYADEHDNTATFGTNPQYEWYWIVTGFPGPGPTSSTGQLDIDIRVYITYYCKLLDRINISA